MNKYFFIVGCWLLPEKFSVCPKNLTVFAQRIYKHSTVLRLIGLWLCPAKWGLQLSQPPWLVRLRIQCKHDNYYSIVLCVCLLRCADEPVHDRDKLSTAASNRTTSIETETGQSPASRDWESLTRNTESPSSRRRCRNAAAEAISAVATQSRQRRGEHRGRRPSDGATRGVGTVSATPSRSSRGLANRLRAMLRSTAGAWSR